MKLLFGLSLYVPVKTYFLYYALRISNKIITHNNLSLQDAPKSYNLLSAFKTIKKIRKLKLGKCSPCILSRKVKHL